MWRYIRDCLENPTFRRILRTERQERGGAPRPGFSPTRGLRESVGKPLGGGEVQPVLDFHTSGCRLTGGSL